MINELSENDSCLIGLYCIRTKSTLSPFNKISYEKNKIAPFLWEKGINLKNKFCKI